jgi:hypothetical protein
MTQRILRIPYNFVAREYQVNFLREVQKAIEGRSEKRYFYQLWHRRSGKDKVNIADTVPRKLLSEPCLVKYVYPTLVMGRDHLWDGIGGDGFRYIEHLPEFIRSSEPNQSRMTVSIKGGSLFQVGGSDHPDSLRGGNPKLVIFSEWADQDPYAWDVIEPILRENDGIAIFNTTPQGDNHARSLYEYAKNNPRWYVETLTALDTKVWGKEELGGIKEDIIKRFEANGRSREEATAYFDQEYMCSFQAPVIGSYYGAAIQKAEAEKRIGNVPCDNNLLVNTFWDLGMDDSMTIWFHQGVGAENRFIDYYENSGEGLSHYVAKLKERGYNYGDHCAPPDIEVRELGTGKSRREVAAGMGINFKIAPRLPPDDGINAVRGILSTCWFDEDKCHRGIQALKNYRKDWDEKNKVFRNYPKHDWSSHGADALRYFAVSYKKKPDDTSLPDDTKLFNSGFY